MSGIVGLLDAGSDSRRAPIDPALIARLTASLAFRGPDAQHTWIGDGVAFGHALLRTTVESEKEQQPSSLDGRFWITADARIDARADLIAVLSQHGQPAELTAPDGELILRAYSIWGEDCVHHLLGDFAFAIWDSVERKLFCARDHFGIKPFYYVNKQNHFAFSNTLNCLREHPVVSDRLNEQAIGDFLLFDRNMDPTTTFFADVQRLPPAHSLTFRDGHVTVKRYWELPIDQEIRFRRKEEYVERFLELMRAAVHDRLRVERASILLSGGLDSSTVAAVAKELDPPLALTAQSLVYDSLIVDDEREYATLVAQHLNIPSEVTALDSYVPYERWTQFPSPEPYHEPHKAELRDSYARCARASRVALTGDGGDDTLVPSVRQFLDDLSHFRIGKLTREVGGYLLTHRSLPRLGLRTAWSRRKTDPLHGFPSWLNPDFVDRMGLRERWRDGMLPPPARGKLRPETQQRLHNRLIPSWFEFLDPGSTRLLLEVRHPFFDVRVVNYSLAVPQIPWCIDKQILRSALVGRVPDSVRLRKKTPLRTNPFLVKMSGDGVRLLLEPGLDCRLGAFIAPGLWQSDFGAGTDVWNCSRVISLNLWLSPAQHGGGE